MATVNVPARYSYKVYDNLTGQYLGKLPHVISEFTYSLEINTGGTTIDITCGVSADTSRQANTGTIQDETGADILDETGTPLLSEGPNVLIAAGTGSGIIKNGNRIVVIEQNSYYPNGRVAFRGIIERWEATFGGEDKDDTIDIKVYSDGSDLDSYVYGGIDQFIPDQAQLTYSGYQKVFANPGGGTYSYIGQTITPISTINSLDYVDLRLQGACVADVNIYARLNDATSLIGTTVVSLGGASATGTPDDTLAVNVRVGFTQTVIFKPGVQYFLTIVPRAGQSTWVATTAYANTYGGGSLYTASGSGAGTPNYLASSGQLYFQTVITTKKTSGSFQSNTPRSILIAALNTYSAAGGRVSYDYQSLPLVFINIAYSFNTNTVLEAIKSALSLYPNGYYFGVDMSTSQFYFRAQSTTPDFYLHKGRHVASLKIGTSIENVKNAVLLTGGTFPNTGYNLFTAYFDRTSSRLYGQRTDRLSENGITDYQTASVYGTSTLASESSEQYDTTVKVMYGSIDISLLTPGKVVGFRGYGSYPDKLALQITRIDYHPEYVILSLGTLPYHQDIEIDRINRSLLSTQTIDNPSSPS